MYNLFFYVNMVAGPSVLNMLEMQLNEQKFADSEIGKFTRLVTFLRAEVNIWRRGSEILPWQSAPGEPTSAMVESLLPTQVEGQTGCWQLSLSIPEFAGFTLRKKGKPSELVNIFGL